MFYYQKAVEAWKDKYDSETNPGGYINLSVAENKLSSDLMSEKLATVPPIPASNLSYTDAHGSDASREVVANFLQRYIAKTPVTKDDVVLLNGACSVLNNLSNLICDPGEHVMVCGPGYRGFQGQIGTFSGAHITIAHLDEASDNGTIFPPVHSVAAMQNALDGATANGDVVRALLVCSPHNPSGEVFSASLITDIVQWARRNGLHVIFDELYALSVHDPDAKHVSVAQVLQGDLSDDVHIVWSMSKDLCSSGVRLGALFSQNHDLIKASATNFAVYSSASRLVEWAALHVLVDTNWLDFFVAENARRLRVAYDKSVMALKELGVPFAPARAGFFILADFRAFLSKGTCTKQAELELWERMCEVKVLVTPSAQFFASAYGFFRICFAAVHPDDLDAAWSKIRSLLL